MKQCTRCGEWKEKKHFGKDKKSKDNINPWCKECSRKQLEKYRENNPDKVKKQLKKYRENNKEKIKEQKKNWYEKNKDKIKKQSKEYKQNNKEWYKEYNKEYNQKNKEKKNIQIKKYKQLSVQFNSTAKYRKEIELYEEIKKSPNDNVMCKCAYCGGWFEPTYLQIQNRISAINGYTCGELRLYCKEVCKQACPTYGQVLYPKDMKPTTAREVQPQLRHMVFERDNYTCQKCNTHKDNLEVELHCHHREGIQHEPLQSADTDMCITFCADCHKEVHQIPGCGYQDMQCKEPEMIYNHSIL